MALIKSFTPQKIIIPVDESENARRAVSYVADMLGKFEGFSAVIVHVIPEPEEDYFPNEEEKNRWLTQRKEKMEAYMAELQKILTDAGFDKESVKTKVTNKNCPSLSECIMEEQDVEGCGTIVIGRQGLSAKEEFLFGSISSKVVHHAQNSTVWVVN